jgi:rhodanese-related sulfurtransferase
MAGYLQRHLVAEDVTVRVGEPVTALEGTAGKVRRVRTDEGEYAADLVLMAVGVQPEVALAQRAGLTIGPTGAIAVDSHCRTSDPSIYAGGDCAECIHRITGEPIFAPMGSTANKHGRVIGTNATGGDETFPGVLGTSVFQALDCHVARTGLTEEQARGRGLDVITAVCPGLDRPHYYPGHAVIVVKLIAERASGALLGAQVVGPGDVSKRLDTLVALLSEGATVDQLATLDLAYAPPYSQAVDVLIHAADLLRNKREGRAKAIPAAEVHRRVSQGDELVLIDVRTPDEREARSLDARQVLTHPLDSLREHVGELPKDREMVVFCLLGIRSYQAQRMLVNAGFRGVRFMEGGLTLWPD